MKPKRNLWPIGIIATYVLFISGTITLVVVASSQNEDLVSDNYYEQEMRYQNRIDEAGRAEELASKATARYEPASGDVVIAHPREHSGRVAKGKVQLYRPSDASMDKEFPLEAGADGIQRIAVQPLNPGLWKVRIEWTVGDQSYFTEQSITNSTGKVSPARDALGPVPGPAASHANEVTALPVRHS